MLNNMHSIVSVLKGQDTDAVVLGGSRCIGLQDAFSDIDICIYYNHMVDIHKLNEALSEIDDEHAKDILLPLNSWGVWQNSGGVCILGGKEYDITLRNLSFVERVLNECISGNIYCMHSPAYPYGYCNSYLIGEMDNCHTLYAPTNRLSHLQGRIIENKDRICNSVTRSFLEDAIFQCICGLKAEMANDIPYRNAILKNGAFSMLNVYAAQKRVLLFHNKRADQRVMAFYRSEKDSVLLDNIQYVIQVWRGELDSQSDVGYVMGKIILREAERELSNFRTPGNYRLLQIFVTSRQ